MIDIDWTAGREQTVESLQILGKYQNIIKPSQYPLTGILKEPELFPDEKQQIK